MRILYKEKTDQHENTILDNQILLNIDCREGIKKLSDKSVSLILTDPPYFIDGLGNEWNEKAIKKKVSKAGVIGSLPIGMKFCPSQSKNLRHFLTPIAKDWMRVIKPGGFVLCFMQSRLVHSAGYALEEAGFHIKDLYVWKRHGQAKAFTHTHFINKRKDLSQRQKNKLIKSINGRKTAQLKPDAEMIIMAQAPSEGTLVGNWSKYKTGFINVENALIEPNNFPSTIMSCPKPKERYGHITAKPVDLLRHLIRIFCEPNGLILDPFLGCGSCAEACAIENYKFIGFEIEKIYYKQALKRIHLINQNSQKVA